MPCYNLKVYFNKRADRCICCTPRYVSLFSIVRLSVSGEFLKKMALTQGKISRGSWDFGSAFFAKDFLKLDLRENSLIRYQPRIAAAQRVDYVHAITGSFRTPPEPEHVRTLVAKASLLQTRLSWFERSSAISQFELPVSWWHGCQIRLGQCKLLLAKFVGPEPLRKQSLARPD